jgi:hypothetical protein
LGENFDKWVPTTQKIPRSVIIITLLEYVAGYEVQTPKDDIWSASHTIVKNETNSAAKAAWCTNVNVGRR